MPNQQQADSPLSPVALAPTQIPPPQTAATETHTQTAAPDPSSQVTVAQLLASGPYACDAASQQSVAEKLKIYKAKVDEVHAMGKVSSTLSCQQSNHIVSCRQCKLTCCSAFVFLIGVGYANAMTKIT